MSPVRNEQTKLLANALDRASTACFTVGIATPLAAWLYNIGNFRSAVSPIVVGSGVGGWFFVAVGLHLMARQILRRLEQ